MGHNDTHQIRTRNVPCAICGSDKKTPLASGTDIFYNQSDQIFFMVLCDHCNHTYLCPRPVNEDLALIYPEEEYYSHRVRSESNKSLGNRLLSRLFTYRNKRRLSQFVKHFSKRREQGQTIKILDLGCGDGTRLDYWKSVFPDAETFGLELSVSASVAARSRGHQVVSCRIEDADFNLEGYDVVYSAYLIEHLEDPGKLLELCRRWVKLDGLIVICMPSTDSIDFRLFRKRSWGLYAFPQHWNLLSAANTKVLADRAGLNIVDVKYLPSAPAWIWSLHTFLRQRWQWLAKSIFPTKTLFYSGNLYNWLLLTMFTVLDYAALWTFGTTSDVVVTFTPKPR